MALPGPGSRERISRHRTRSRGYGETDKPATGYDKRNMAQDLIALLDEPGIDQIALVGQDQGARVATRFAL